MPNPARTAVLLLTLAFATAALAQDGRLHPQQHQQEANPVLFDAQIGQAMERMHRDMAVVPSGDPDRDFAAMMIPHHQGAVDMARIQLQFGKDLLLRRLAQAIIVEQLQEIDVMRRRLKEWPTPPAGQQTTNDDHPHIDSKEH